MSQKQALMMMMVAAQRTLIQAVKNLGIPKIFLLQLLWIKRSVVGKSVQFLDICPRHRKNLHLVCHTSSLKQAVSFSPSEEQEQKNQISLWMLY